MTSDSSLRMSRALSRRLCALPLLCSQSLPSWRGLSWLPAFLGGSSSHPSAAEARHILLGRKRLVDPYRLAVRTSLFVVGAIDQLCSPLHTSLPFICPTHCLRSWLSDYNQARDYIRQEQARFNKAAQQLAPLQQQLLSELRWHVRVYQVRWPAGRLDCTLPQPSTHHLAMHLFCAG